LKTADGNTIKNLLRVQTDAQKWVFKKIWNMFFFY